MKILRLGHASYLLTSRKGKKYLVDPFLSANPGCPKEYTKSEFLKTVDAVFVTHAHFDHTSGLDEVLHANPEVPVICQYDFGLLLMQNGVQNVQLLNYGGSVDLGDMKAVMVQAVHTSSYRETEGQPVYAGQPAGYVFDFEGDRTLYHSGDTAMTLDMKLIQEFYQPDVAILSSSGQFVMGPEEAVYVVKNLLDVEYVIPNHHFPNETNAPQPEVLQQMLEQFPVIQSMIDADKTFIKLLDNYEKTTAVQISFGEEIELAKSQTDKIGS